MRSSLTEPVTLIADVRPALRISTEFCPPIDVVKSSVPPAPRSENSICMSGPARLAMKLSNERNCATEPLTKP